MKEEPEAPPTQILTPSTKAAKGNHDVSASRAEEILAMGQPRRRETSMSRAGVRPARVRLRPGRIRCAGSPLVLVDTKYENRPAGPTGTLCFIDEIHTPDSSRYWYADDYEERFAKGEEPRGLDKEYVRRALVDQGYRGEGPGAQLSDDVRVEAARRYIQVCELLTGRPFVPNTDEPMARIRRNLKLTP